MTGASIIVAQTPKGKFKAYFWGQADGHVSDWRGCNYRYAPLDGQPLRGFDTSEEAKTYALSQFQTEKQVIEGARRKPGRHMSDNGPMAQQGGTWISVYTPDVVERMNGIK